MRKRTSDNSNRRDLLIRGLVYGTLAVLFFAVAVSSSEKRGALCLRDIGFIEGDPAHLHGFGLVVGLDSTGDGSKLAHTDRTLRATLSHLGIDASEAAIATGKVAAVMVQAELNPGMEIGMATSVRVTALNDATDLSGGRLVPLTLSSRDGRFRGYVSGATSIAGIAPSHFAPASGLSHNALICSTAVFMADVPDLSFVIELRGVSTAQIASIAERINQSFGQIAHAHSGCDIEITLPAAYDDYSERASLVLQIAALPLGDIVPDLLVERDDLSLSIE